MVQSPSKILKSDYRLWDVSSGAAVAEVYKGEAERSSLITSRLYEVLEFVIYENSQSLVNLKPNQKLMLMPLFGKVKINGFHKVIETGELFVLETKEAQQITVNNVLADWKSDILVLIIDQPVSENVYRVNHLDLQIRNKLNFLDIGFSFPGFIGLFNGRESGRYVLKNHCNKMFAFVINGAFEFQNRLMETRDAILIWDIEELEFEALSEDALILFLETQ